MPKRLLVTLLATIAIAGCGNSDAGRTEHLHEQAALNGAYTVRMGQRLCQLSDSQVANVQGTIDLFVKGNEKAGAFALKGYEKAETDFTAMEAKGRIPQFKATECPKLTRQVTAWRAPPPR